MLRKVLTRVGAPTQLHITEEADRHFHVLKKSHRNDDEVREELVKTMDEWIQGVLGGTM